MNYNNNDNNNNNKGDDSAIGHSFVPIYFLLSLFFAL